MIFSDYNVAMSALSMPGGWEWIGLLLIVLIIFGPKRLPQLSRSIGKSIRDFKKGLNDVRDEIENADVDDDNGEVKKEETEETEKTADGKQE